MGTRWTKMEDDIFRETWVTRQTESGVVPEQVSRKAFWATSRVGFATEAAAIEHAQRCNEAKAK